MPEEPDEVFYDWGKIVSEPSEPRKFYDESGKLVDGVFLFCDSEKNVVRISSIWRTSQ